MTGPGTLPVGHPVAFRMNVSNTTGGPLTDANLRVRMAPGLQHLHGDAIEASLGDLAPGQSKELTLEAITVQTGWLTADATLLSGKKTVATAQATVVAVDQPTLGLRQTGPMAPPVGGEHEFKLEVMNRSATEVRDVELIDVLPEGLHFTAGDSKVHFDAATRTLRWSIGSLAPGQARQFVFRAEVRGTGAQINRISALRDGNSRGATAHGITFGRRTLNATTDQQTLIVNFLQRLFCQMNERSLCSLNPLKLPRPRKHAATTAAARGMESPFTWPCWH